MDFNELKEDLRKEIEGNGVNPLGTGVTDLKGKPLGEIKMGDNLCTQLEWLNENSPYTFRMNMDLGAGDGTIGVSAYNDEGKKVKTLTYNITGGDSGNPVIQIFGDLKKLVNKVCRYVEAKN